MKSFKKRLLKTRLTSVVLAIAELTNIGAPSYAMMPSELWKKMARAISVDEMQKMSAGELFNYLKIGSTDKELRLYYQNGTLDKVRCDVKNFDLFDENKKKEFFDYIVALAYEGKLEGFDGLPTEIRMEFINYVIRNHECDFKKILDDILRDSKITFRCGIMFWLDCVNPVATPRVTGLIVGKYVEGKDSAIDAITNYDLDALVSASARPNFNYDGWYANRLFYSLIDYAALIGNVKAFKFLMINGANITKETEKYALMGGDLEIIHLIEQYAGGYSEVINDEDVLAGLINSNREDIFNWLQKFGETTKEDIFMAYCRSDNILFLADMLRRIYPEEFNEAIRGEDSSLREEMLSLFLTELEIDVNAVTDEYVQTALISAVVKGNIALSEFLINNGADVNATDGFGETALMWAVTNGNAVLSEFLISNGADVNAKTDGFGETALMWVRNVEVAKILIDSGVDINAVSKYGMTALMYAIRENNVEVAKLLIENGADVNIVSNKGETALSLATKEKNDELVKFLKSSGAEK